MGDMGDFWRDVKASRSAHKRQRAEDQRPFIEELKARAIGVGYVSAGFRFVFEGRLGQETFDYWPQSGKWCEVKVQRHRQGERALLKRLAELGIDNVRIEEDDAGLRRILSRSTRDVEP